jgi:hypothetical protein
LRVRQQIEACRRWEQGEIPAGFHRPVAGDIPVLLVSGELDPVTPPLWAERAAAHLPQSFHLVLPEGHHGPGGLTNQDCYLDIEARFLEQGSARDLDASCAATMKRPPFILDEAGLERLLGGG